MAHQFFYVKKNVDKSGKESDMFIEKNVFSFFHAIFQEKVDNKANYCNPKQ